MAMGEFQKGLFLGLGVGVALMVLGLLSGAVGRLA